MGIIPTLPEYGETCYACWTVGKTPVYMKAFISGVSIGELWLPSLPPAPNGYWDIEQVIDYPCVWEQVGLPPPTIRYRVGGPSNFFYFRFQPGVVAFVDTRAPGCQSYFTNQYTIWFNNIYYGGHCWISTPDRIRQQIEKVTPMIDPDPRMELFPMADGLIVIRYAGKRDGTKIYIKVDTNA